MALFIDRDPELRAPRAAGGRVGWVILGAALVGVMAASLIPAPYVIEQPGPVFDTLGSTTVDGVDVPLIEIPDETTYPTDGSLDMLTVSIRGNRSDLPNWLEVVSAWFDPSMAVVPVDEIYPVGVTREQSNEQSRTDMANSQKEAVAAALTSLGYTFASTLTVVQAQTVGPSDGLLKAGDVIVDVNGTTFTDVTGLRKAIADNGTVTPADITIRRDGVERTVSVTPTMSTGADPIPIVGIVVGSEYDFPVEVKIQLENVGGPSAGMMFALGIIDKLTPGALNGGNAVAGTGTISATGGVGAIGGIRQKLYGAKSAGAEYFLAPSGNCDEVVGHVPDGLIVFSVSTLDDSLRVLSAIEEGADTTSLPACAAE